MGSRTFRRVGRVLLGAGLVVGCLFVAPGPASAETRTNPRRALSCTLTAKKPVASGKKAKIAATVSCSSSHGSFPVVPGGTYEVRFQLEEQDVAPNGDDVLYSTTRSSRSFGGTWSYSSGFMACANEVGKEELTTRVLVRRTTVMGWTGWSAAAESSELSLDC